MARTALLSDLEEVLALEVQIRGTEMDGDMRAGVSVDILKPAGHCWHLLLIKVNGRLS